MRVEAIDFMNTKNCHLHEQIINLSDITSLSHVADMSTKKTLSFISQHHRISNILKNDIRLCLTESISNALIHAYGQKDKKPPMSSRSYWQYIQTINNNISEVHKQNPERHIKLTSELDSESIRLTVKDQGDGFNYQPYLEMLEGHTDPQKLFKLFTGRGLYLISQSCKALSFDDNGRRIEMTWRL